MATISVNNCCRCITPIHENNKSLMSKFYQISYRGNQLLGLITVWKYKHFIHVLDLVTCNGWCIDPFSLSDKQTLSTRHNFSREKPTHADSSLWHNAISALCKGTTGLSYTLRPYLIHPHLEVCWYTNTDSSGLYQVDNGSSWYQVFHQISHSRSTSHVTQFDWSHQNTDVNMPKSHLASTEMVSHTRAVLHSSVFFLPIPIN